MEEKKLDLNSIIGFVLISGLLIWMLYSNAPTPEELEAEKKAKTEQVQKETEENSATTADFKNTSETIVQATDSLSLVKAKALPISCEYALLTS